MEQNLPNIIARLLAGKASHIGDGDEQTRFLQYSVVTCVAVIALTGFGIYNWQRGEVLLSIILIGIGACLSLGWITIIRGTLRPPIVYRFNNLLFSALLIHLLFLGAKDNSMILWINIAPLVMFFFMGRREGLLWTATIWIVVVVFFFGPFSFDARDGYSGLFSLRFLVNFTIISYITYFYENFRHIYRADLEDKNNKLLTEIDEKERIGQSLRESEERYRAVYLHAAEGILLVNFEGDIVECNPQILHMLKYREEELIGTNIFSLFHPEDLEKTPPHIDKLRSGEVIFIERQLRTAAGIYLLCEQSGKKIGEDLIILLYRDIRERKIAELALEKANEALERLAHIDGLTQVANRRRFDGQLDNEWQRMFREGRYLGLIFADIDFFKQYNDVYGHQRGDECLKKVAEVLSSAVHRPADLVARYGGEEFVVLLPDTDMVGCTKIAEKMRQRVEGMRMDHQKSAVHSVVTMSFGVAAVLPATDSSVVDLVRLADKALYAAKEGGRNKVIGRTGG